MADVDPAVLADRTLQRTRWWNDYFRQAGYASSSSPPIARSVDDPIILRLSFVRWLLETRHQWCERLGEPACCDRDSRPPAYERLPLPPSWEAPTAR